MRNRSLDSFGTRSTLSVGGKTYEVYRLSALEKSFPIGRMPITLKIFLENMLRHEDGRFVKADDIKALAAGQATGSREVFFMPGRVLMQDFTGVPAVVDLAAMRDAMKALGGDPKKINPLVPVDLVIDHSVQVDKYGTSDAFQVNSDLEFERNRQRYVFLKWGQKAFGNFTVVPPETGIVHQVNLEYLAGVVTAREEGGQTTVFPDTLVGTDSHTTMINGLGVLGWGVGGIEAEAVMLGQPMSMLIPEVVGFRLTGKLAPGATATDAVLTVTELLRKKGVVGKFVEFFGPGLSQLSLADRATISNMCPEYGATVAFFPVDVQTIEYLKLTGRPADRLALVEAYCKAQGMFRAEGTPEPSFQDVVELDLGSVEPSIAGPKRPQDRVPLAKAQEAWRKNLPGFLDKKDKKGQLPAPAGTKVPVTMDGRSFVLGHDSVVIAAITSCTNTSNPSVLIGAGLVAKKAVERGLSVQPWVKTSLAPGSKVVTDYLKDAGLTPYLEKLKFHLVGYGCTTCIAAGTPVLLANGTARPIERLPDGGGALVFGPTKGRSLATARQTRLIRQGTRACVTLVLQDGRELVCTPDHEILTADGRWVRADRLEPGSDRLVVGLDVPLDEPSPDEAAYILRAGKMILTLDTPERRARSLAFARLLGYLLGDGSISTWGQGRITVGQAADREAVLNDVELVTGKRPAGTRYDELKWSIALPRELTTAFEALPGVPVGRRINQPPRLPEFILDDCCPVAMLREFLGGLFGADGTAPTLHRFADRETAAAVEHPAYSQSAKPEDVPALKGVMAQVIRLLARCGASTEGSRVYDYPVRRSASTYPAPQDGSARIEVRLSLSNGLSFIERVGFRYCADKALRASAAAAYWRTIDRIGRQRLWMAARLEELRKQRPDLTFRKARELAAVGLRERGPVVFPHYSLLEGHDRFDRLPQDGRFKPLHRDSCGFPSPVEFFEQLGVREWFAPLSPRGKANGAKRYCVEKEREELPTFTLGLIERRPAGEREVFDLTVSGLHAFIAGTVAVHNCIGNSGPLAEPIAEAITANRLLTVAVLSGNRNFEGRINPHVKANYLASPGLVVAYAIAGRMDIDLSSEPLGTGSDGRPVYLRDIWPSDGEVQEALRKHVTRDMFVRQYKDVYAGDANWSGLECPAGERFAWDAQSTYIKHPPYFERLSKEPAALADIKGGRVLAVLGDSVTTDHISPAGSIPKDSPAGQYLVERGTAQKDFNSYGARRGNHELMVRGTFANIRLRNALAGGTEGGVTVHLPEGSPTTIFEASARYQKEGVPLLILAGKEYGSGSSRDWAAKGPNLLGVKAVIAESYERIHRSNLVGMGILPLQFPAGESAQSLGLAGTETFSVEGIARDLAPRKEVTVTATGEGGKAKRFKALVRIDTPVEIEYFRYGGILPYVLIQLLAERENAAVAV